MTNLHAIEHLLLRLRPLNRALRAAVEAQEQAAAQLFRPDLTPLCITDDQVRTLLNDVDGLPDFRVPPGTPATLTREEQLAEDELRNACATSEITLPLDQISRSLALSAFEQETVLLCAAVEINRSYERIYAYILDDLNRRYPCIELLCSLTTGDFAERCARRQTLSRYGKLRRLGVLQEHGGAATESRQELRLAPSMFAYITGAGADPTSVFRDRAEVALATRFNEIDLPSDIDPTLVTGWGNALREHRVAVLGVWGPQRSEKKEVVTAIAAASGLPLRRLVFPESLAQGVSQEQHIRESLQTANALNTILMIDTEPLTAPGSDDQRGIGALLADQLASSAVPIILTGIHPWRPTLLLETRPYADLEVKAPTYAVRQMMWERAFPDLSAGQRNDLAARFRLNSAELRAVSRVVYTQAVWTGSGDIAPTSEQLEQACAMVMQKNSSHFATVIKPKRGPDDLILPTALHQQVLEVAQFFTAWPHVAEVWGVGRLTTGEGGIKALFTGDPGTGKTLAAEVIAKELQMTLLKIDLSQIVSKWVGETEKHLEQAFREGEDSNAVLFFDEADALFGKRGEVRHGVDRYANMEVSYLLQRIESYSGLVILASNLRDNIDSAFTRRFQIVLQFPRPEPAERRRIWEIAFPKSAPLEEGIDFDLLSQLDLTGAGIVGAAQTAALMAMDSANGRSDADKIIITKWHVVQAIARQYSREARLLTLSELGPYAPLLQEAR